MILEKVRDNESYTFFVLLDWAMESAYVSIVVLLDSVTGKPNRLPFPELVVVNLLNKCQGFILIFRKIGINPLERYSFC